MPSSWLSIFTGLIGIVPRAWELKGMAIACYTIAVLSLAFNTRFDYHYYSAVGIVKLITLTLVAITGLVVLGADTPQSRTLTATSEIHSRGRHQFRIRESHITLVKIIIFLVTGDIQKRHSTSSNENQKNPIPFKPELKAGPIYS